MLGAACLVLEESYAGGDTILMLRVAEMTMLCTQALPMTETLTFSQHFRF